MKFITALGLLAITAFAQETETEATATETETAETTTQDVTSILDEVTSAATEIATTTAEPTATSTADVEDSVAAILAGIPELSNLTQFVGLVPDLIEELESGEAKTLFAPSNDALAEFLESVEIDVSDTESIADLLSYHVVLGAYNSTVVLNLTEPEFLSTALEGQVVQVVASDDEVTLYSGLLSNASVEDTDYVFSNGYIHVISSVLTPPLSVGETAATLGLSSVAGALETLELTDTLEEEEEVTIFAPNNAAFNAIGSLLENATEEELAEVLQYHVVTSGIYYSTNLTNGSSLETLQGDEITVTVEDDQYFVNGARVLIPNVLVENGVVHVIDSVLNFNATEEENTPDPENTEPVVAFPEASSVGEEEPFTTAAPTATQTVDATSAAAGAPGAAITSEAMAKAMHVPIVEVVVGALVYVLA